MLWQPLNFCQGSFLLLLSAGMPSEAKTRHDCPHSSGLLK